MRYNGIGVKGAVKLAKAISSGSSLTQVRLWGAQYAWGKHLRVAGAIQKVAGVAGGAGKQQPVTINVTLELDKRVLARHVEEVMVDKLNPATA